MNTLNPKLLEGFDQKPLLERLEHLYRYQEELYDSKLLDQAVAHFEEELTHLEIDEFRESDVKDSKKERFEELLHGLKTLSANISKIRERNRQKAEADQKLIKKTNLLLAQVKEWEGRIKELIDELIVKLRAGEDVHIPKYWDAFEKLKTTQPDSAHTKKLKDWKDFLNQIPEYQKIEFEKKEKIKKSVENENQNKKRKERALGFARKHSWKVLLGLALVASPYVYQKFNGWYQTKKAKDEAAQIAEQKKEKKEKIIGKSEKLIALISAQQTLKNQDLPFLELAMLDLATFISDSGKLIHENGMFMISGSSKFPEAIQKLLNAIEENQTHILREVKKLDLPDFILTQLSEAFCLLAFNQVNDWGYEKLSSSRIWDFTVTADNQRYNQKIKTARYFAENIKTESLRSEMLKKIDLLEQKPTKEKKEKLQAEINKMANEKIAELSKKLSGKTLSELGAIFYEKIYQETDAALIYVAKEYVQKLISGFQNITNESDFYVAMKELKLFEKHQNRLIEIQDGHGDEYKIEKSKSTHENAVFGMNVLIAYGYQSLSNYMKKSGKPYQEIEKKADQYWTKVEKAGFVSLERIKQLKETIWLSNGGTPLDLKLF